MKTVLYVLFYRNRPAVIALVLLLAVRFVQAAALARGALVIGETFGDAYAFCSGANMGAFVFTPLLVVAVMRPAAMMAGSHFAAWSGDHRCASLRCLGASLVFGLVASALLNLSAGVAIALAVSVQPDVFTLTCSFALQVAVCSITFMVYVNLLYAIGSPAIAFMGCVLYGLWGFMAQNVVGGGVPSVGWGLTVVFGGPAFKDVIFRFSLFGMAFVVLFLISFFSFQQKDYVAERDDR